MNVAQETRICQRVAFNLAHFVLVIPVLANFISKVWGVALKYSRLVGRVGRMGLPDLSGLEVLSQSKDGKSLGESYTCRVDYTRTDSTVASGPIAYIPGLIAYMYILALVLASYIRVTTSTPVLTWCSL